MRASLRLGLCLIAGFSCGQTLAQPSPALPRPLVQDSVHASAPTPIPRRQPPTDSARIPAATAKSDSLALPPKSRSDTVIVAKHQFNHREQIITGSVIMTCLAVMMVAMNNYNPR